MVLQDISPRHCNRVRPENRVSGLEATVIDLVSVHLKDLDSGDIRVLDQVVQMEVGAEGEPMSIEGGYAAVGYMKSSYGCLQRT